MKSLFCSFIATTALPAVPAAVAAVFHATPGGAGRNDGTDWQNAAGGKVLGTLINETMQPGDELLLGSGSYTGVTLTINKSGLAGKPRTIIGVDRGEGLPVLVNEWSNEAPEKGATVLRLGPGVSHVNITGLRVRGGACGVSAEVSGTPRTHLVFRDVDVEQCRHGFFLADCDDLRLENCDLKRYTKHAFRFAQGCDRVTIRQCTADCSEGDAAWEKKTELFPFGFIINNTGTPNTAFQLEDCLARNNMMPLQKNKYKNGDGFVVEENAVGVTFLRCRALRNQDGGFDVKSRDVRFTGCVALGNGRGFRVWTTGTLENCFAGWGSTGLWCNGGPVTARDCTFHALTESAVLTDDGALPPVTLQDCLVTASRGLHRTTAKGQVIETGTVVLTEKEDPGYLSVSPAWDGLGDAMNSRNQPGKGYRGQSVPTPPGGRPR